MERKTIEDDRWKFYDDRQIDRVHYKRLRGQSSVGMTPRAGQNKTEAVWSAVNPGVVDYLANA